MGHARLTEHIDAPIDQVWDLNASCERVPEWNVNIVEVRDCQGRLDRVGAKTTTVGRIMGRNIDGFAETTKADKPHASPRSSLARAASRDRSRSPTPKLVVVPTPRWSWTTTSPWGFSAASPRSS
jgi:hypothetical protein